MFSIVSAAYNINAMSFDWRDHLLNWIAFLDGISQDLNEIVLAVNTSGDDTVIALEKFFEEQRKTSHSRTFYRIVRTEVPYTDPTFDGQIKDAALQAASQKLAILLDLDEVLPLGTRDQWVATGMALQRDPKLDGLIIPSIDVCKTWDMMKGLGQKFYLVKTGRGLTRGVPAFAKRADGSIDTSKSDTTEVLRGDQLASFGYVFNPEYPELMRLNDLQLRLVPYVMHLGWLHKAKRLKANAFWKPVWEARAKEAANDIVTTEAEFDKIAVRAHGLPHWTR